MKGLFQNLGNMKTVNNLNIVFTLFFNFFETVLFFWNIYLKLEKICYNIVQILKMEEQIYEKITFNSFNGIILTAIFRRLQSSP